MNRPHFRRHPRPTDPEPYTRLDRLDGLGTRYDAVLDSGPADPEPTRYDAEWPDVRAAEAGGWAGGDLAAMAAPFVTLTITPDVSKFRAQMDRAAAMAAPLPGMARDDLGDYAEPVTVSTWTGPTYVPSVTGLTAYAPANAFGRILADLASLEREIDAFADGRAYETGTRCRTASAALRRATEHLGDGPDGARRAALVLAGFTGAEAWAV